MRTVGYCVTAVLALGAAVALGLAVGVVLSDGIAALVSAALVEVVT